MIIKLIKCTVIKENKNGFSTAQESWKPIIDLQGFIMQLGGWEINNENHAYILSIWDDKKSIDNFMTDVNDEITDKNNQSNYYNEITIDFINIDELKDIKEILKSKNIKIEIEPKWTITRNNYVLQIGPQYLL